MSTDSNFSFKKYIYFAAHIDTVNFLREHCWTSRIGLKGFGYLHVIAEVQN